MLGLSKSALRAVDQELKEAVCAGVVNLAVSRVTGSDAESTILYGISPRRSIVSGQLLPRFDAGGQADESSDIRIAAIGLDFRIASDSAGAGRIQPHFSVYVRVLPDWAELQNANLGLEIPFELQRAVQTAVDARIRQLRDERFRAENVATPAWATLTPQQKQRVREQRTAIQAEVRRQAYREQGIELLAADDQLMAPADAAGAPTDPNAPPADDQAAAAQPVLPISRLLQGGRRIPFQLLQSAAPPAKWRRLALDLPTFDWSLGASADVVQADLTPYNDRLRQVVTDTVTIWLTSAEGMAATWRDLDVQPQDVISEAAWLGYRARAAQMPVPVPQLLPKVDGIVVQIDRIIDLTEAGTASVRVVLDNRTPEGTRQEAETRCDAAFSTSIDVAIPAHIHRPLHLDRVEPSYRFRQYLDYPAIGLNCGVTSSLAGQTLSLRTTWSPTFVQPRIIPREGVVPVQFQRLASDEFLVSDLRNLPRTYEQWINEQENSLRTVIVEGLNAADAHRETERFNTDLAGQRQEVRFIEQGIRLLEESQAAYRRSPADRRGIPYRAWLLMNRSFFVRDGNDAQRGWRLFQLAFVLAHVSTFASRMDEYRSFQDYRMDEEAASLLYFPTGGGKSEAFYGALLYAMFLDRLRGKQRGVTALIRYPLRLLTLQQGQRLLKLIAHAELVRLRENVGEWPFEIGFWVGGKNTPNRYRPPPSMVPMADDHTHPDDSRLEDDAVGVSEDEIEDGIRYREYRASYNKVSSCPVCGEETGLRRYEGADRDAGRLGITCFSARCAWNTEVGGPLPFLLTDDTIYQRAPAIVLGTVDKLAMLGQHTSTIRQVLGMFGLGRTIGPTGHLYTPPIDTDIQQFLSDRGHRSVFPAFSQGDRVFVDPFPSLIIQDEAHLLEESLGTFSGLFDSLLETTLRDIDRLAGDDLQVSRVWQDGQYRGPRMPKIIAATATISNPDRQLEVLYQREPLRFPYPGPDLYRSFFAEPAPPPPMNEERTRIAVRSSDPEATSPWMRLFVSLMTNDASHTVTAVSTLSSFHLVITNLYRDLLDPATRAAAIARIRAAQGSDAAAVWRQAAIDRALAGAREVEIMALVDLHRIALAYVTNKKGGDQVMDALDAAIHQRHRLAGLPPSNFISRLISGGIDMKDIQSIMSEAEGDNEGRSYPELSERVRNIVATSAISHGVDVDRFNSMFFAGLPSDIAEYIQASSRVGRTHVGFVMLLPTPQSRRDRYVVETHDIFHRFLERMIAPPAVERWAENAIRRVLASLVQTWAILREAEGFFELPDDQKARAQSFTTISPVSALARNDQTGFVNEVGGFILRGIGFDGRGPGHRGQPVYADLYRNLVGQEVTRFARAMRDLASPQAFSDYWADSPTFKPPMTSLRDVDEAGIITAGFHDARARQGRQRIDQDDLMRVMRAIRSQRGVVAETDGEVPERGAQ